jgi:hypothetical protein
VPSEQGDAAASQFVAALGATMAAADYTVTMVRGVMKQTSRAYGLDHQFLALPNYVQVGSPTGEGMYIANPDFAVRFDQSFPLARLVARAPTGAVSPHCALAISHRPNTPPTVSLVLPGFWLLVPGSLGFMGVTQLVGTHSTAVFTATLISMMSIAVGVQTGLLLWRAAIQMTSSPNRRAFHD